ncbi:hypothetical protein [Streptomyces capitiformicae]|uniref:Integral membrane protein n=1 Tax=Streptomyces capitiformicae TaxID=2014920 RepID=A0A919L503_9ACTN|nr:hypothetical protein [Streptomyces capitiformicae]GHH82901.1 hypothetical protein GCM10017771_08340 [Streptomyces capitiformicae]
MNADRTAASAQRMLWIVAAGFCLLSAVLVPLTLPLGWDEIVYASRFGSYGPATPFSAPRTRGVPLLLAPIASWSDSTVLLRVWLLLLAGGALWLGFRPWLRILHRPAAAWVAAGLYGSLWITLFYAGSAMPNHYTAMGATAAVGCFLAPRPRYAGVAAGLAVVTLMRPNDGVAVAVPLLLAAVLMPTLRGHGRLRGRLPAVAAGLVAGALPWVVEAEVRFGGVRNRFAEADQVQGGLGAVFSLRAHLTALDGPLLCRPCTGDSVRLPVTEWWVLLPLLVGLGLWAERRARRSTAPLWLAVAVAVATAAPYLFLVPYAAPRFLLPAYALLALPAAVGLLAVVHRARTRRSVPTAAVLALALLGHWGIQAGLVHTHAGIQQRARGDWERIASVLREHGVHPPCVLAGNRSTIPIAHTAGCTVTETDPRAHPSALVLRERKPPHWARDWQRFPVPDTYNPGWTVVVRP